MSNSVTSGFSSRFGRNSIRKHYNIDDKFSKSPYLANLTVAKLDKRRRSSNSLRVEQKPAKSPRRRTGESSDMESVITRGSVKSYRTNQTSSYRRSIPSRNTGLKNLLIVPRDVDKLLRGFRQKHSNHPILTNCQDSEGRKDDDDSTIASDFAMSINDEAVYKECNRDEQVKEAIFSCDLFSAISLRSANKQFQGDRGIFLPSVFPVVASVDNGNDGCDVSDLESVHSVAENVRVTRSKVKGRKKR